MKNAIEIANFYYQNLFDNFSMTLEKNHFFVFSGPNNCGKTTLLRILSREIITSSDIKILGYDINHYPIDVYARMVGCIIPGEIVPKEVNIEEELYMSNSSIEEILYLVKGLKIKKILRKKIKELSSKDFLLYQIATTLARKPKILLMDSIRAYFNDKEVMDILSFIKEYQRENEITVFYIAGDLQESLLADTLFIMNERRIVLKGEPLEVLEKDNVLNKIGLRLPFMVDLSVKLRDYDLIKEIELDKVRMVDTLWK